MAMRFILLLVSVGCWVSLAQHAQAQMTREDFRKPERIPFPEGAPYDREIATLGKMLFFDPRLSRSQNMSCATCHNPSFGWETPVDLAIGADNQPLGRHAPTIVNAAWLSPLFWDGRAASLEAQAEGPITDPNEMNGDFEIIIRRLKRIPLYSESFSRLFPDATISRSNILRAIATYERTIVSGQSRFDRWVEGDEFAITKQAKRGFELFVGKANCADCHNSWNFTNNQFFDIGLITPDHGRVNVAPYDRADRHKFKVPGLRNITLRAPYMHNGVMTTLEEVILHYADGREAGIIRPVDIQSFSVTDDEVDDIVAFLKTLTEESTDIRSPVLPTK